MIYIKMSTKPLQYGVRELHLFFLVMSILKMEKTIFNKNTHEIGGQQTLIMKLLP